MIASIKNTAKLNKLDRKSLQLIYKFLNELESRVRGRFV